MNLVFKIKNLEFKNPIFVAAGTFGYAREFEDFLDFKQIGAVITKTLTLQPKVGNPAPRLLKTASGLLFSIGLENPGIDYYLENDIPYLKGIGTHFICSFAGETLEEYIECITKITKYKDIKIVEVNLSCPNVNLGCLPAQDKILTFEIIKGIKNRFEGVVIAKLSPNVTDIVEIAKSAQKGGADAITIANGYEAIAVDAERISFKLGNITGGLGGSAIKPLTQHLVWNLTKSKEISIPIIAVGGISSGLDVAEYLLLGASATQVGTSNLSFPTNFSKIYNEFTEYCSRKDIKSIQDIKALSYTLQQKAVSKKNQ